MVDPAVHARWRGSLPRAVARRVIRVFWYAAGDIMPLIMRTLVLGFIIAWLIAIAVAGSTTAFIQGTNALGSLNAEAFCVGSSILPAQASGVAGAGSAAKANGVAVTAISAAARVVSFMSMLLVNDGETEASV